MITPKFEYFLIFSTIFAKKKYFNSDFVGLKHYYTSIFGRKSSAQLAFKNELWPYETCKKLMHFKVPNNLF